MTGILRATNLSKTFHTHGETVKALRRISLEVDRAALIVIAGRSGSGKTTLLNLIGGLDRPTSGSLQVNGRDLSALDEMALCRYRRSEVGFIFQGNNLIPTLNVFENIEMPLLLNNCFERSSVVRQMLARVGLQKRANTFPAYLSGGEQQRVAIARALIHDPPLVLADEPTANLDTQTAREIFDLIQELQTRSKTTILFATHDPMIIEKAQRVLWLTDGTLAAKGLEVK